MCVRAHLLQLDSDHAESSEHTLRRTRDGHDSLRTRTFRDVDPGVALWAGLGAGQEVASSVEADSDEKEKDGG